MATLLHLYHAGKEAFNRIHFFNGTLLHCNYHYLKELNKVNYMLGHHYIVNGMIAKDYNG